jgi:hypothetical protein
MFNEVFGWVWFVLGMASGAVLGLGFARDGFLGGYGSWERRLLRLGHVSFFGLGLINILFAHSVARVSLGAPWPMAASVLLIVGGVAMPVCCGLAAWRKPAKVLFPIPVAALLLGTGITAVGLTAGLAAGGAS